MRCSLTNGSLVLTGLVAAAWLAPRSVEVDPSGAPRTREYPFVATFDNCGSSQRVKHTIEHRNNVLFHDDNDRSIEKQVIEATKNAQRHNLLASLARKQYQLLGAVISETV